MVYAIVITVALHSGEMITWQIKHLDEPVPIIFAWTIVEQTDVVVGTAGSVAGCVEDLLEQLTRLTPDCPEIAHLDAGFSAYRECKRGQHE